MTADHFIDATCVLLQAAKGLDEAQQNVMFEASRILLGHAGAPPQLDAAPSKPAITAPKLKSAKPQAAKRAPVAKPTPRADRAPALPAAPLFAAPLFVGERGLEVGADFVRTPAGAVELSEKRARFVLAIARGKGEPVGRDFVVKAIWKGEAIPSSSDQVLYDMTRIVREQVASIGLVVKPVPGVGIALQWLEGK
jgi:hypothetical protein